MPDYTIDDLDFLALAESIEPWNDLLAAFSGPWDEDLEAKARTRGPDELIFYPAPSETPRCVAAMILARGEDPRTLGQLARACRFADVLALVARNPFTPVDALRLLVANPYVIICQGAAKLLPATDETYDLAAPAARITLLCRPEATRTMVARGATDPLPDVRMVAAAHTLASPADLAALIADEESEVAEQAAANSNTPVDALSVAMRDQRPDVHAGLASNPRLPAHMMRTLVANAEDLMKDTPPLPLPRSLSHDEVRAALTAHDAARAIFRTASQRTDLAGLVRGRGARV
jgi:hypothetical protein